MQKIIHEPVTITTPDGRMEVHLFHPDGQMSCPGVVFYMDAFGVRGGLMQMARRLAEAGYRVALPDLYYRAGGFAPFDVKAVFAGGPERERLSKLMGSITPALVMRDTGALLDFLGAQRSGAGQKFGCVGYCMGGGLALTAAGTFPDRIAAAASFHGGRLATDKPDSPHLLAPRMRAGVYIGVAGIDQHFTPEEKARLETALRDAGVDYSLEVYEGAGHGFAVNDSPAFDAAAAERHFQKLVELLAGALGH